MTANWATLYPGSSFITTSSFFVFWDAISFSKRNFNTCFADEVCGSSLEMTTASPRGILFFRSLASSENQLATKYFSLSTIFRNILLCFFIPCLFFRRISKAGKISLLSNKHIRIERNWKVISYLVFRYTMKES